MSIKAMTIKSVPFMLLVRPGLADRMTPRQLSRLRKRVNQGKTSINPLADDMEFEDTRLTDVTPQKGGGFSITFLNGWSFGVPAHSPVVPTVGCKARTYGAGIGSVVRGLMIDDVMVFYRTVKEQDAEHKRWCRKYDEDRRRGFRKQRSKLDASYNSLPRPFQLRIDRFRAANPNFRWEYEGYEMFVCEQAVLIANACQTVEALDAFHALEFDEQLKRVPGLSDGHSGNTFGAACCLAKTLLQDPVWVEYVPGAMAPLVGTSDYSEKKAG